MSIIFYILIKMKDLHLDTLKEGLPGVTKTVGSFLAEAAALCLESNGHQSGLTIQLGGDVETSFQLFWTDVVTEQVKKTWKDKNESSEYGATAIAILVLLGLTDFIISERGIQTGTADYLLTTKENNSNLQNLKPPIAHLEVSGIWGEKPGNTINVRLRDKKKQVKAAIDRGETVFIIVTEFGIPKTKIKWYNYEHY